MGGGGGSEPRTGNIYMFHMFLSTKIWPPEIWLCEAARRHCVFFHNAPTRANEAEGPEVCS